MVPPLSIIYRKIAISFVVLTVLLVGMIVFFSLAKATVTITPKQELKSAEFLVMIKPAPALGEAAISGSYTEKVVEEEGQFEATGVSEKPGRSVGTVTIENTTSVAQALVATTRLLTPEGVLFRMKKGATIPAKGELAVEVQADQPGPTGDVEPTRFTIPGLNPAKQKLIFGESKAAMTGGAQKVRTVTADDLEKAKIETIEKAIAVAKTEFGKSPAAALGGLLAESDVQEVEADAKKGDERQTFAMKAKVTVKLLAYEKAAVTKLALEKVSANVPTDRELVEFNSDSMIVRIKNVKASTGEVQISVYGDAQVRLNAASPILDPVKIAGMPSDEATQYLKSFDAIEQVEVKLFPSWQKRIPTIPDRIKIVIKK